MVLFCWLYHILRLAPSALSELSEIYTDLTKLNLITSSVIESAVVTASKQQSDLIRTALQSFMDLLEGRSPAFFLSGLGCGIAIVSQYCINREQKTNTWH